MSLSVSRSILTFARDNQLRCAFSGVNLIRFNHTNRKENVVPDSAPGKITTAILKKFSEPLYLETVESPKNLQPNEVLIDIHYCALNTADALLSKNSYNFEPKLPIVLGYELVGKLAEVGEEAKKGGYKVGDKVIALNKERYGGLAEQCIAEVGDIWKVPSAIKSVDAVSLIDNYVSALMALERKVSIQEDDMILINVGVSGIGLAAADLATNVFRAKVLAVCATEEGASLVRDRGVYASFKFKNKQLLKQIGEVAADRNIKMIFDDDEGETFKKILRCFTDVYKDDTELIKDLLRDDNFGVVVHHLSREGRVVIAGTARTSSEAQSEDQKDSFSVTGFNLREYRKKKPEAYRQAGDEVLQFIEEGLISPTCSVIIGLNKVNDALQYLLDKKSPGKVIIDIRNKDANAEQPKK